MSCCPWGCDNILLKIHDAVAVGGHHTHTHCPGVPLSHVPMSQCPSVGGGGGGGGGGSKTQSSCANPV